MGLPEMEKEREKNVLAYLTKQRKGGLGCLELSYHPFYFLFGHRRKFGNDEEKQQQ